MSDLGGVGVGGGGETKHYCRLDVKMSKYERHVGRPGAVEEAENETFCRTGRAQVIVPFEISITNCLCLELCFPCPTKPLYYPPPVQRPWLASGPQGREQGPEYRMALFDNGSTVAINSKLSDFTQLHFPPWATTCIVACSARRRATGKK